MRKKENGIRRLLTCITFFICFVLLPCNVFAEQEHYISKEGHYSITIPEGFSHTSFTSGTDTFLSDNMNDSRVITVNSIEAPYCSKNMLIYMEEDLFSGMQKNYVESGIPAEDIVDKGFCKIGENQRGWLSIYITIDDIAAHLWMTCGDYSYLYCVTLIGFDSLTEEQVLASFVLEEEESENSYYSPETEHNSSYIQPKGEEIQYDIEGKLSLSCDPEDYYVFIKGKLDGEEERIKAAGADRERIEEYLNPDVCLLFPTEYTVDASDYWCFFKILQVEDLEEKEDLLYLMRNDKDKLFLYLMDFEEGLKASDPSFVEIGDDVYAFYEKDDHHVYLTFSGGSAFMYDFGFDAEGNVSPEEINAFEEDVLSRITYIQPFADTAAYDPSRATGDSMRSFDLMDGRLNVTIDGNVFDVFLKDNTGNDEAIAHSGVSQEKMDLYMSATGYDLMAVPAAEENSYLDADYTFLVHVKKPEYEGIENFSHLGETMENLFANNMITSFGLDPDSFEIYKTENADYIVFEALNSIRYATIMDGSMIYFYIRPEHGEVTDEHREMLRSIMEGVTWRDM